jgi:hypothetical protein
VAFTENVTVAAVPQPSEYVIVAVPSVPDVTNPDTVPTLATAALLLLHVPLGDPLSLSVVVIPPEHNGIFPTIATGVALTVKVTVAAVPQPSAYVIVAVPSTPVVTNPDTGPTLATEALLLLHVPLGDPLLLSVVVDPPAHNGIFPPIVPGVTLTVNVIVTVLPQPSL